MSGTNTAYSLLYVEVKMSISFKWRVEQQLSEPEGWEAREEGKKKTNGFRGAVG